MQNNRQLELHTSNLALSTATCCSVACEGKRNQLHRGTRSDRDGGKAELSEGVVRGGGARGLGELLRQGLQGAILALDLSLQLEQLVLESDHLR